MRSQLKSERGNFFLPHRDLNHGPLQPIASVLTTELHSRDSIEAQNRICNMGVLIWFKRGNSQMLKIMFQFTVTI